MNVYLTAYKAGKAIAWLLLDDTVEPGDTVTADEETANLGADLEWALTDGDGNELTERKVSAGGESVELSFART